MTALAKYFPHDGSHHVTFRVFAGSGAHVSCAGSSGSQGEAQVDATSEGTTTATN